MRFGSLFSGIEAASAAWLPLGWECAWVAEIDPFACAVLKHHYPDTPNLGDMTKVDWNAVEPVDLVVGGPPCQDFSVAGQRAGIAGERGDLSLAYVDAIDAIGPVWSLTENVPGWLSMGDNSFGHFLGRLVGADAALVPGDKQRWTDSGVVAGPKRTAAWRICDAQYFGVPQRRRRVFVVAVRGAGNWACAEALFPQQQGVPRNFAPRREARQDAAAGAGDGSAYSCRPNMHDATGRGTPLALAIAHYQDSQYGCAEYDTAAVRAGRIPEHSMIVEATAIATDMSVRRLTPRECEKLQGFEPGYTAIPYRGKPAADGNRYRAIGNSMAVPVVRWIGRRIQEFEGTQP